MALHRTLGMLALLGLSSATAPLRRLNPPQSPTVDSGLCGPCVQIGSQAVNALLNYILNAGVVGGCGELCSKAPSKSTQTACDIVCSVVGIKAFTKALNHTDIDPIYFCEELHACAPGSDNASVKILGVQADPPSIKKGDTVQLMMLLGVGVPSGVGEFHVAVHGPVTTSVSQSFLLPDGLAAGNQSEGVSLKVQDDESGDFPVIWSPGTYNFTFEVCQGECRSKHPHSKFFGSMSGSFQLSEVGKALLV